MLMRGTGQEAGLLYILAFTIHDIHIDIDTKRWFGAFQHT